MPFKDPEKQRQAQKELMRQRRARSKEQTAGSSGAPPVDSDSPPESNSLPQSASSVSKALPAPSQPGPAAKSLYDISPEFKPGVPGCMWKKFPWERSRKCFNADGQCCYDLEFPVPWERTYCPNEHPLNCEYFRKTDVRDHMEPLVEVKT